MTEYKAEAFGYKMTSQQLLELQEILREDILLRYDNEEYYDKELIEVFAQDNNLEIDE